MKQTIGHDMLELHKAITPEEITIAKDLFLEYASSLNFSLCFQNFSEELQGLPGEYAPPEGCLLIAYYQGVPAGCVGLRKNEHVICEMKRLYVKDRFRGLHIGLALAERLINEARKAGYRKMRLDTVGTMKAAQKLYESLGFKDIEAYTLNPVEGVRYMELSLQN